MNHMNRLPGSMDAYPHKINLTPTFILEIMLIYHFKILWASQPCQTIPNWYLWIYLPLLWMVAHTQKMKLIPKLILEIFLIYHFEVLWAQLTMPDHTHLILMNKFVASMHVYLLTKYLLHKSTHCWDIGISRILRSDKSKLFLAITWYGICIAKSRITRIFIPDYFQENQMTKFFKKY